MHVLTVVVNLMLHMDPKYGVTHYEQLLKSLVTAEELEEIVENALSELFSTNTLKSIKIAETILNNFAIKEKTVCRALYAKPLDVFQMKKKRGYVLPMLTNFGVRNGGMSDAFMKFIYKRFGMKHFLTEICLNDLLIGGIVMVDTNVVIPFSILPFGRDISPLDENIEKNTRESISFLETLGITYTTLTFRIMAGIIRRTKTVPPRFLDFMAKFEAYLLKSDDLKKKEWVAVFYDKVIDNKSFLECLPPATDDEFPKPRNHDRDHSEYSVSSAFYSVSQSVRMMDLGSSILEDIRKFYNVLSELTVILKSTSKHSAVSGLPELPKDSNNYPFARWIKELDDKAAAVKENEAHQQSPSVAALTSTASSSVASFSLKVPAVSSWTKGWLK